MAIEISPRLRQFMHRMSNAHQDGLERMRKTAGESRAHQRATESLIAELDRIRAEATDELRAEMSSVAAATHTKLAALLLGKEEFLKRERKLRQLQAQLQYICAHEMEDGACRICRFEPDEDD